MTRKFKAIALALTAVLAMSALAASSAQAQFTSNKEHTILSGSQEGNMVFTAGSGFGGVTCSTVSISGTSVGFSTESLAIVPTYSGCKDSLGRTVHVHNSSSAVTVTSNGTAHLSGGLTLTITGGGGTVVCTVVVKSPQTNGDAVHDNLGGTSGIRSTVENTDIINTTSGGFFNCGMANGEHTTGTLTGTTVLTGKATDGSAASISVE